MSSGIYRRCFGVFLSLFWGGAVCALEVNITPSVGQFEVRHGAKTVTVLRKQDPRATIEPGYALTSRKCPPFCAQPMVVAPGVKTIGEVELIDFMTTSLKTGAGLLVDAREERWHEKGTIPGSINVPFTYFYAEHGGNDILLAEALERFGAVERGGRWDFTKAKILALWCNGPWCGQSPMAIRGLLALGYPADKLLYYRGGMQDWLVFGLTIVPPADAR